jgi:SAM-dependent methyltransferase
MTWVQRHIALAAGNAVLDAGCGPGLLWADHSEPVPPGIELTVVDLSPGMVAEAVARTDRDDRYARVTGRTGDLQDLPLPADRFDRVVALHMLYHLPEPRRGVAEIARVLRPDGRAIVATNGSRHLRDLWALYHEIFEQSPLDRVHDVFSTETGFPILRDHFERVAWFAYDDTLVCTDPADVVAYLFSVVPGDLATDEQRERIRHVVHQRFDRAGGRFVVAKDSGCFVCEGPRAQAQQAG